MQKIWVIVAELKQQEAKQRAIAKDEQNQGDSFY